MAKKPKPGSGKRFQNLKSALAKKKGVTNPGALAASIGRKKFGSKKFSKLAMAGKKASNKTMKSMTKPKKAGYGAVSDKDELGSVMKKVATKSPFTSKKTGTQKATDMLGRALKGYKR